MSENKTNTNSLNKFTGLNKFKVQKKFIKTDNQINTNCLEQSLSNNSKNNIKTISSNNHIESKINKSQNNKKSKLYQTESENNFSLNDRNLAKDSSYSNSYENFASNPDKSYPNYMISKLKMNKYRRCLSSKTNNEKTSNISSLSAKDKISDYEKRMSFDNSFSMLLNINNMIDDIVFPKTNPNDLKKKTEVKVKSLNLNYIGKQLANSKTLTSNFYYDSIEPYLFEIITNKNVGKQMQERLEEFPIEVINNMIEKVIFLFRLLLFHFFI